MEWNIGYVSGTMYDEITILNRFGKTTFHRDFDGTPIEIEEISKKAVEEIMLDSTIPDEVKASAMRLYMENEDVSV